MTKLLFKLWLGVLAISMSFVMKELERPELDGQNLAQKYCNSCHLVPKPGDLDKKSWSQYVLPRMGKFMQIVPIEPDDDMYDKRDVKELKRRGILMDYSSLSKDEWTAIKEYYISNAPEKLPGHKIDRLETILHFKPIFAPYYFNPPSTTLVNIESHSIWAADAHSKTIYQMDKNLEIVQSQKFNSLTAVCMNATEGGNYVTFMGSFTPTDDPSGEVFFYPKNNLKLGYSVIKNLRRPVNTQMMDMNKDGLSDMVISEFGKWLGQLSVHYDTGNGQFRSMVLDKKPGCLGTQIFDFDGNGYPDIMALFAQGDEQIRIYYNDKNGEFIQKTLLRFPPSYGSSGIKIHDFNKDGLMDIMYFNGDLADFPIDAKHYQGIRIYINHDKDIFNEQLFLPMSGVYGASIGDFDQDGDDDIAAISFFPNFNAVGNNSFCLFIKDGMKFTTKTFIGSDVGRWIMIDEGDFDKDGDIDLVLGNLIMELPGQEDRVDAWSKNGLPFLILENTIIKKL